MSPGGPPWRRHRHGHHVHGHPWHPHRPRHPFGRIGHFVRARLHRRIFAWFGLSIFLTGAVVSGVMAAISPFSGNPWRDEMERGRRFTGVQFARVWDRPDEREALARSVADELELGLVLHDAATGTITRYGAHCPRTPWRVPVVRDGARLGEISLCVPRRQGGGWRVFLGLAAAGLTIWAVSGKIARRLARPLDELARVAQELGEGNLKARATVDRHTEGEARLLGEAINEMADRIERQLADQRELLAAVSHELRTPLGHLRLLAELARDGSNPRALDEIDQEVVELDALVGQLLASSRLDFHNLTLSTVDPVDAARRALDRAGLPGALLRVEGTPALLQADPTLVSRALSNLLENARKHASGATALVVSAVDEAVRFEVQDAGPGLAAGEETRIFDPFYRSSQAQPRDRESVSLGLGLALVKRIAEAHRGSAFARNLTAGGAAVGFELPLARA